jgi:hypothetical protein
VIELPAITQCDRQGSLTATLSALHVPSCTHLNTQSSPGLGGPGDLYWWVAEQQEQEEEQEGKEQEASTRAAGRPSHLTADWEKIQVEREGGRMPSDTWQCRNMPNHVTLQFLYVRCFAHTTNGNAYTPCMPYVLSPYLQALSALDASLLRALDELDAAGYSEEVGGWAPGGHDWGPAPEDA